MGETRRFFVRRTPSNTTLHWASIRRPPDISVALPKLHLLKVSGTARPALPRAEAKGAGLVTSFRNAHAPQVMIHGSKPISATIGNYNAVYRVLKGTTHEWMLERHLEPKQS